MNLNCKVIFVLPGPPDNSHCGGVTQVQRLSEELNSRGIVSEVSWIGKNGIAVGADDVVIATAWQTVGYCLFFGNNFGCRVGHYVQNWEDNPVFSGSDSLKASVAMTSIQDKMVVSEKMLQRWPEATLVPPVVGPEHYGRVGIEKDIDVLVHLHPAPYKGSRWAIEVAVKLRDRNHNLKIVGIGQGAGESLTDEEVSARTNRAKVLFMPSQLEGATSWVPEALLDGCRVVATRECGWIDPPEVVLCDYGNTEMAVKAIEAELDCQDHRSCGREWARSFTRKRAGDAVISWLEKEKEKEKKEKDSG